MYSNNNILWVSIKKKLQVLQVHLIYFHYLTRKFLFYNSMVLHYHMLELLLHCFCRKYLEFCHLNLWLMVSAWFFQKSLWYFHKLNHQMIQKGGIGVRNTELVWTFPPKGRQAVLGSPSSQAKHKGRVSGTLKENCVIVTSADMDLR